MEVAITTDPALKQAIADYPTARLISESIIEQEVRDILASNSDIKPKKKVQRGKYGPWIITITLSAALAVSYYQWNRHTDQKKIYAAVMETYTPPINKGSRSNTSSEGEMNVAIREFDLRNFDASYELLQKIQPKTDSVYWYLGHIALINGKVYEAKNYSKKIRDIKLRNDLLQYIDQIIY